VEGGPVVGSDEDTVDEAAVGGVAVDEVAVEVVGQVGTAPLAGGAVAVMVELLQALQVRWDRDSGRWFAFVLLACAVVCLPAGLAAAGWGYSNSTSPVSSIGGQGAVGGATCGSDERSVTTAVRGSPIDCGPSTDRGRLLAWRRPPCDHDHTQSVPASIGNHGGSA
jgi:hypothetical protein